MIYVALPNTYGERSLTFFLATEEYVARNLADKEYFFMWRVPPTVIFGRNQLIENEVNMDYCHKHNIMTFRRKSGGGCVYADMSNIMFSYITPAENINLTFNKYVNMVAAMLQRLGVDAKASGRNDIMIGDRKVSGNAFYHIPGRSIVHGTMLYDTNMENMVGAITPSDAKLVSKGIKSVRQHIALLKDYINMTIDEFMYFVRHDLCDDEITLDDSDIKKIEKIEQEYLSEDFIYGNNPKYNITRQGRIDGVGDLIVNIEIKNRVIKNIDIVGDYFLVGDIGEIIIKPLCGKIFDAEEIGNALPARLDDVILNLKKEDFIKIIMQD